VGERLKQVVSDPPASSEQILHQEKYWDPEQRDAPVTVDDAWMESILADAGFKTVARNTAGEIGCAVATTPANKPFDLMAANAPSGWTNPAATGWGGDRFYLLEPIEVVRGAVEGTYRGLWLTAWDTPEDRNEFVNVYLEGLAGAAPQRVDLGERTTAFLFAMTREEAEQVTEVIRLKPPRLTRDGTDWD
jgi:hypothetical protein